MATETSTQAYGEPSYWDNRYSNESGPFDWYQKYHSLAPLINLYAPRHHRILAVGCGNSGFLLLLLFHLRLFGLILVYQICYFLLSLFISILFCMERGILLGFLVVFAVAFSEGMIDDGYEDVVNVDISSVVIEAMQKKYCNRPQLKYVKMDVRDMSAVETCSFDTVLDKVWK